MAFEILPNLYKTDDYLGNVRVALNAINNIIMPTVKKDTVVSAVATPADTNDDNFERGKILAKLAFASKSPKTREKIIVKAANLIASEDFV